jgi:hypothetical protein
VIYEYESGFTKNISLTDAPTKELLDAVEKYVQLHSTFKDYLVPLYKNGIPEELT